MTKGQLTKNAIKELVESKRNLTTVQIAAELNISRAQVNKLRNEMNMINKPTTAALALRERERNKKVETRSIIKKLYEDNTEMNQIQLAFISNFSLSTINSYLFEIFGIPPIPILRTTETDEFEDYFGLIPQNSWFKNNLNESFLQDRLIKVCEYLTEYKNMPVSFSEY